MVESVSKCGPPARACDTGADDVAMTVLYCTTSRDSDTALTHLVTHASPPYSFVEGRLEARGRIGGTETLEIVSLQSPYSSLESINLL